MAGKRSLSQPTFTDLGARKRQRAELADTGIVGRQQPTAYGLLSDELWLLVFAHLDFGSLAAVERVDRHFLRLSNDGQLWKSLYLGLSLHARSSSGSGLDSRPSPLVREIATLPSRAATSTPSTEAVDYKHLYRVRTNFSNGRSVLTSLPSTPIIARTASLPIKLESGLTELSSPTGKSERPSTTTLLVLASPYIVTFPTSATRGLPSGSVFRAKAGAASPDDFRAGDALLTFTSAGLSLERQRRSLKLDIRPIDVALDARGWVAVDEIGSSRARSIGLYVGWSSGAFSLFAIRDSASSSSSSQAAAVSVEEVFFQPSPTASPLHLTVGSALYGPLLVNCSDHFRLSFFHLPGVAGPDSRPAETAKPQASAKELRPFRSLRSLTSWHPSTLRLAACPLASAPDAVKLAVAYAVPCYPDLFSVARQEVVLRPSRSTIGGARWDWLGDRSLSALAPTGLGAFWQQPFQTTSAADGDRPTELGTVGRVSAVAQDDRWVCLAGEDNVVQVFEVPDAPGATRLEWRQTLWAHSAGVTAVSVRHGRCVTADSTGRLLIWDLGQLDRPRPMSPSAVEPGLLPSPPSTPLRMSSSAPTVRSSAGWVEVLTPRQTTSPPLPDSAAPVSALSTSTSRGEPSLWTDLHAASTGRGSERIELVVQDGERIVSVGVLREAAGDGDGAGRVKVWAFDG